MVDYVIVGGGVYGCAVGWELAGHGYSVRLLEAGAVAGRASGGPGRRGVRANGRDPRELPLMQIAYEVWPSLHEKLGSSPFYERVGQLLLLETPDQVAAATARCQMQLDLGIESRMVGQGELREMEPELNESIVGALFCERDGVADHSATTRAYAAAATARGVDVTERSAMRSIEVTGSDAQAVITADDERIEVGRGVIMLSNSEVASQIRGLVGVDLPVWNGCFQVLMSEPLAALPLRHLVGHVGRTVSLKADGANKLMISGGWTGTWDEQAQTGHAVEASVAGNVAETVAVYPCLSGIEIAEVNVSHLESVSADDIPIIDTVPGIDNVWFGTGWSGHGWAIAPVISEALAGWISSGTQPELLRPFSLGRFRQH
jgi:sarcosine oxidase subunit beta